MGPLRGAWWIVAAALVASGCGTDAEPSTVRVADPGRAATWVLADPGTISVPPPPAAGSAAAVADDRATRDAVTGRTAAQADRARNVALTTPVAPWLGHAMGYVAAREKDPPASSRAYALVAVAMHDASVAAYAAKERHRRPAPDVGGRLGERERYSYPSAHAAIATAGAETLLAIFDEAPEEELRAEARTIGEARVLAGAARPGDVTAGEALGRAVARKVAAHARTDGSSRRWRGRPPGGAPRYYEAPAGSAARPVQPLAGTWKTWVLSSGRALRPPPPPAFGTPGFEREVRAVVRAREELTPAQDRAARFWAGGEGTPLPAGVWVQVVLERLRKDPVPVPDAARTLALVTVAMADAGVAAWDAKYAYWYPRPERGVPDSGLAPGWKPLLETPFFPAYVSGHAAYSGAAAEVLSYLFPEEAATWRRRAREAADARVWGGIHWPVDSSVGLAMGQRVGKLVVARAREDAAGG